MSDTRTASPRRAVEAAYYAFVLSIPLESIIYIQKEEDASSGGVSISRILGIVLFGLAVVNRQVCFRRIPTAFWLFAWYLGAYTLSQLWIPSALDARFHEQQFALAQMAVLFLISANLFEDDGFRGRVLRLYGWAIGLTALAMALGAVGEEFGIEDRRTVFAQNPNTTAALFAYGILCIASDPRLLGSGPKLSRLLLTFCGVGVLAAGILRTGSRSGLLALTGGIIGLGLSGAGRSRAARLAIAAVSLALIGMLVRREFRNDTLTAARLERSWTEGDTSGRTTIYDAAWAMFQEKPLMGWGGANNRFVLGTDLNRSGRGIRDADRSTHNVFLAVLTEVGLVGGMPFIAGMLLAMWTGWLAARRRGDALPFALMCALLIVNVSGTGHRQKIFWIILAAATAAGTRKRVLEVQPS